MTTHIEWYERTELLQAALAGDGAFLIVNGPDGRPNPMTIGWAQVGVVWSRPMMSVLVRESRFTHACIEAAESFTVSVPRPGTMRDELAICGSRSGRDTDKIAECSLAVREGLQVDTPVLSDCALHYECRIVVRTQQARADFSADDVLDAYYPQGDHHLIVYGEIVAAYLEE